MDTTIVVGWKFMKDRMELTSQVAALGEGYPQVGVVPAKCVRQRRVLRKSRL